MEVITIATIVGTRPKNKPEMLNKIERVSKIIPGANFQGVTINMIPTNPSNTPTIIRCNPINFAIQRIFKISNNNAVTNNKAAFPINTEKPLSIRDTQILTSLQWRIYQQEMCQKISFFHLDK